MKGIINLTPLLDVILILLFAFMIRVDTGQKDFEDKVLLKKNNMIEKLSKELTNKQSWIVNLEDSLVEVRKKKDVLSEKIDQLSRENTFLRESVSKQNARYNAFREEVETKHNDLSDILSKIFNTKKIVFMDFIKELSKQNQESLIETLDKLSKKDDVVHELLKYDVLNNHFFPIDVRISENDLLYVNRSKTNIKAFSQEKVNDLIFRIIKDANREVQGVGRIILLWSYDQDATAFGKMTLKKSVNNIYKLYGVDKMILANCGYIPRGNNND